MRLRRVGPDALYSVHALVAACGRALNATLSLAHWDPPYPLAQMKADAVSREIWAVFEDGGLAATFTVGTTPIAAYDPSVWATDGEPALYLNRLAVAPALQGHGLGRRCMAEVERIARDKGCRSVRCDAIAAHAALLAFYRGLGYAERGPFVNQGFDVVCLERLLAD